MDIVVPNSTASLPFLGYGLGLRPEYYEEILSQKPDLDWFEVLTENYLVPGGKPLYYLDKIRELYPVVMHGVSLSLGSTDPIDRVYLQQVKSLAQRLEPAWISDHLCWTGINGLNLHDLLPIPYTYEAISHLVSRIQQIQDALQRPLLIENVSSYLTYKQSQMTEWDFISEILKQSGCYLLLDVNNVYVSSINHSFSPLEYINALPAEKVAQIHLAGHANHGDYIIDTHDSPIIEDVWALYAATIERIGPVSTMVERDDNMPPLSELIAEVHRAKRTAHHILSRELCYE